MDERVLGPTREAALEEITECRQKMGTLLVTYFIVILLLVLYGGGNLTDFRRDAINMLEQMGISVELCRDRRRPARRPVSGPAIEIGRASCRERV